MSNAQYKIESSSTVLGVPLKLRSMDRDTHLCCGKIVAVFTSTDLFPSNASFQRVFTHSFPFSSLFVLLVVFECFSGQSDTLAMTGIWFCVGSSALVWCKYKNLSSLGIERCVWCCVCHLIFAFGSSQKIKEENERLLKEYGYCVMDNHKERIANFKIEPPGLFRGRGNHPKMGMLKRRIMPEDIIINCSKWALHVSHLAFLELVF